jgi:saccharopine dehydrogenase-like NADP-dependent oxidoreductase
VEGSDQNRTAMAKTVGLPIGIVTKMILNGDIMQRGVIVPVHKEVYQPILNELKKYNILFTEKKLSN